MLLPDGSTVAGSDAQVRSARPAATAKYGASTVTPSNSSLQTIWPPCSTSDRRIHLHAERPGQHQRVAGGDELRLADERRRRRHPHRSRRQNAPTTERQLARRRRHRADPAPVLPAGHRLVAGPHGRVELLEVNVDAASPSTAGRWTHDRRRARVTCGARLLIRIVPERRHPPGAGKAVGRGAAVAVPAVRDPAHRGRPRPSSSWLATAAVAAVTGRRRSRRGTRSSN